MQPSSADAASRLLHLPSFLIGGFEGADHTNSSGVPVAMLDVTGHAQDHAQNYARLRAAGIRTVRESVGWSRAERDRRFDLSCARRRAEAARRAGVEIIWTLWHYGMPADVDFFDAALADRFAQFAYAAAMALREFATPSPLFCPINEISFVAWAVCESTYIHPHRGAPGEKASARGFALKKHLVRAALAGCDAIRDAIPDARMLHIDPLIHVVAPTDDPSRDAEAARVRGFQFQAFDMLTGRLAPELGGAPRYVDCIGVNYYHGNQFEVATERRLHWHLRDPRRIPFRALLRETFARYRKPLLIAETSHVGVGRGRWIAEIAREIRATLHDGVPVAGLCLYPIVDRPDWERLSLWHHSGLWDRVVAVDGSVSRRLDLDYLAAVRYVQRAVGDDRAPTAKQPSTTAVVVLTATPEPALGTQAVAQIAALAETSTVIVASIASTDQPDDDTEATAVAAIVDDVLLRLSNAHVARYAVWLHTPMALPIVAQLAPDVIAYSPEHDVEAVGDPRHSQRHRALLRIASIVGGVTSGEIERARRHPATAAARASIVSERLAARTTRAHERVPYVIVGGGLAGLCAAWRYGAGALVLERDPTPGGSRRSFVDQGFRFDMAPHVIDGRAEFADLYRQLLGENVAWREPRVGVVGAPAMLDDRKLTPFLAAFADLHESVGYPLRGGTQALVDGFLPLQHGTIACGTDVIRILPRERSIVCDDGRRVRYDRLLVTLPLPALVALCHPVPDYIRRAAQRLRTLSLRVVNIGFRGRRSTNADWQIDATDAPFDRVFLHGNVAVSGVRSGHFALACEIVHSLSRPLALHGSMLVRRCIDACVRNGWMGSRDDVVVTHENDFPVACVVDDDPASANRRAIARWLDAQAIAFTGSQGRWEIGRCADVLSSASTAALAARRAAGLACEAQAAS